MKDETALMINLHLVFFTCRFIFCCCHLRDPGTLKRSFLACNSKVAEIVYISCQWVETSSFGLSGNQLDNSFLVDLWTDRLCEPCISISKPLLATLFGLPSCSDFHGTTLCPRSHLSLPVFCNIHLLGGSPVNSLIRLHHHGLSRPVITGLLPTVELALAKSDLRGGAVHHSQPYHQALRILDTYFLTGSSTAAQNHHCSSYGC